MSRFDPSNPERIPTPAPPYTRTPLHPHPPYPLSPLSRLEAASGTCEVS